MIRPLTDHVDDWPMDPEDTVGYGQPPVLPGEEGTKSGLSVSSFVETLLNHRMDHKTMEWETSANIWVEFQSSFIKPPKKRFVGADFGHFGHLR